MLWQASAIVAVGLAVGVPLGLATGRWAWSVLAESTGAVVEPVAAIGVLIATIPLAFVLAALVAVLPARAAGRLHPAEVLRAE